MSEMTFRILVLVGSLRAGSINRRLAEAAIAHAPAGIEVDIFEGLAELPFYNEDLDIGPAAEELRTEVRAANAVLLVSPEYNGTLPAVLKNAIDWLSRPFGAGAISGKPVGVIGTTAGSYGGVWAHADARRALGIAGATVVEDVTLSVGASGTRFGDTHPADDAEIAGRMPDILVTLATAG